MLWGHLSCLICDESINRNGSLSCQCTPTTLYRNLPVAPITSPQRLSSNPASKDPQFLDENELTADLIRYNKEKLEYNQALDLDEEIETDFEEQGDFRIGEKRGEAIAPINDCLDERRCEQAWQRYRTNHPAWNRANAPKDGLGPGSFHRFLELPFELRALVYEYALPNARQIRQWQLFYETGASDGLVDMRPLDTRFLAVNRQLHHEALRAMYLSNTFVVDIDGSNDVPLFIEKTTGTLAPRPTAYIKRWHLIIIFTDPRKEPSITHQLRKVHDIMRQCYSLDSVRFTCVATFPFADGSPLPLPHIESMLRMFEDVRPVKEVVFTNNIQGQVGRFNRRFRTDDKRFEICRASKNVRRTIEASMTNSNS